MTASGASEGALADLATRWSRALVAARAFDADRELCAQRAFVNGERLGRGFARTYGREVDLTALPATLGALRCPCLEGSFRSDLGEGLILERPGCAEGTGDGAAACDFQREAVAGLVVGLTGGKVRHARHASLGHGDARCVDALYSDPESPLRFGPIPDAMRVSLEEARASARIFDPSTDVVFLGLSEGVLVYRADRRGCRGAEGGVDVARFLERSVRRRLPGLSLLELSPSSPGDP